VRAAADHESRVGAPRVGQQCGEGVVCHQRWGWVVVRISKLAEGRRVGVSNVTMWLGCHCAVRKRLLTTVAVMAIVREYRLLGQHIADNHRMFWAVLQQQWEVMQQSDGRFAGAAGSHRRRRQQSCSARDGRRRLRRDGVR
jgi:hypothetical protein